MTAAPRQPLDAEEARIARVYAALPSADPSPALDARILAQARAAVAKTPRKRRPWFLGAGLGTAAAAVFAAGIAWQLGVFKAERGLSSVPEQLPAAQEEIERIDIEFMKQEQELERKDLAPPPAAPKPQAALGEAREQTGAGTGDLAEKERNAQPFPPETPAPAAPPIVLDEPVPMSVPPPPATASTQDAAIAAPAPEAAAVVEPAPAAVPPPEALQRDAAVAEPAEAVPEPEAASATRGDAVDARQVEDDRASADAAFGIDAEGQLRRRDQRAVETTAGARAEPARTPALSGAAAPAGRAASNAAAPRDELAARSAQLAKQAGLPPWTEDAALAPEPWLERIRDRVQAGDRQGAEYSLRRFVLAHPDRRVPRDLQRLLVE